MSLMIEINENYKGLESILKSDLIAKLAQMGEEIEHMEYTHSSAGNCLNFYAWTRNKVVVYMGDSFIGKYLRVIDKEPYVRKT